MIKSLREARKAKGLKQYELAAMANISRVHLSNLERGLFNPSRETKAGIEKIIGRVDWIGGRKSNLRPATWQDCESALRSLVEHSSTMNFSERKQFSKLVRQFFN